MSKPFPGHFQTPEETCLSAICLFQAPRGDSHIKKTGMLAGNFEFNPKRRPICAWLKLFVSPQRYQKYEKYNLFFSISSCATLNESFMA